MFKNFAAFSVLLLSSAALHGQPTELRGTVTDAMCGKHHMMKNASAAECTRACVKSGSDFALISGDKLYTLRGDKAQIDKFAGSDVVISGDLNGSVLTLHEIKSAH